MIGKFGELFSEKGRSYLVDILTLPVAPYRQNDLDRPVASQQPGKAFSDQKRVAGELQVGNLDASEYASQTPRPYIAELPHQILGTIFSQLDRVSILRLMVMARVFWEIGWYYLERSVMGCMAPWAGHWIICVGEYVERNDNPTGLLTEEEEEILDKGISWNDDDDNVKDPFVVQPASLFLVFKFGFRAVDPEVRPHSKLLEPALEELNHLPEAYRQEALEFARTRDLSQYFPPKETWLLRNLTSKRTCLRTKTPTSFHKDEEGSGPHMDFPGFGEVVLYRIWSTTSTNTESRLGYLNRGVWAGHRFDMCTVTHHEKKNPSR